MSLGKESRTLTALSVLALVQPGPALAFALGARNVARDASEGRATTLTLNARLAEETTG